MKQIESFHKSIMMRSMGSQKVNGGDDNDGDDGIVY